MQTLSLVNAELKRVAMAHNTMSTHGLPNMFNLRPAALMLRAYISGVHATIFVHICCH